MTAVALSIRRNAARKAGITPSALWAIRLVAWVVLAILLAPLIVLVGASFSTLDYVSFPPKGFSLQWYAKFFADPIFVNSLILSALIAVTASALATALGFPAAYVLVRKRFPGRGIGMDLVAVAAIGAADHSRRGIAAGVYRFRDGDHLHGSVVGAHSLVVPYVVRTVGASLIGIDPQGRGGRGRSWGEPSRGAGIGRRADDQGRAVGRRAVRVHHVLGER